MEKSAHKLDSGNCTKSKSNTKTVVKKASIQLSASVTNAGRSVVKAIRGLDKTAAL